VQMGRERGQPVLMEMEIRQGQEMEAVQLTQEMAHLVQPVPEPARPILMAMDLLQEVVPAVERQVPVMMVDVQVLLGLVVAPPVLQVMDLLQEVALVAALQVLPVMVIIQQPRVDRGTDQQILMVMGHLRGVDREADLLAQEMAKLVQEVRVVALPVLMGMVQLQEVDLGADLQTVEIDRSINLNKSNLCPK